LVIRFNGIQIVHPTSEKIHPLNWIADKTKGKNHQRAKKNSSLNHRLDDKKAKIQNAFTDFKSKYGRVPDAKEFKVVLASIFGQTEKEESISFIRFVENYITESLTRINSRTGKAISPETIKPYRTLVGHLNGFEGLSY